jgi:hypothetical protein
MPQVSAVMQALGRPRILGVRAGRTSAAVDMRWAGQRATFLMTASGGRWRLSRILRDGRPLTFHGIRSP